jgi:tetratricopeptide (TPR) repeat protein
LLLEAGRQYMAVNDLAAARSAFEKLTMDHHNSAQAFAGSIELANVMYRQGEAGEALRLLMDMSEASAGRPRHADVALALGRVYRDMGFLAKAGELYQDVAGESKDAKHLAESAQVLFEAEEWGAGLAVAQRVPVEQLPPAEAYAFLNAYGQTLLRANPDEGVSKIESAAQTYPDQRTPEGDRALLQAYLATNRSAAARTFVMDLEAQVKKNPVDTPRLQDASVLYGDYLFNRGDYRAAADTYKLAADKPSEDDLAYWAKFQRANALFRMNDFEGSAVIYDEVAAVSTPWTEDAQTRARAARLELRLRGLPVSSEEEQ